MSKEVIILEDNSIIDYELLLHNISSCRTKKELVETFRKVGLKTTTKPTETENTNDLYFQFADKSRLHFQKYQFTLYTSAENASVYFQRYSFSNCYDGCSNRTRKVAVPKTEEELKYIISFFLEAEDNLI